MNLAQGCLHSYALQLFAPSQVPGRLVNVFHRRNAPSLERYVEPSDALAENLDSA